MGIVGQASNEARPPSTLTAAKMEAFGVSMTVLFPKARSRGNLWLITSALLGGHGMLLYGKVSTGLVACYWGTSVTMFLWGGNDRDQS